MIRIIAAGPLSTVQDGGRIGGQQFGFSESGAIDKSALKTANILVGNAPLEGALEMTLKGVTAQFFSDCTIALTGAEMSPLLNGREIPNCRAVHVTAGSILHMSAAKSGCRGYLAVGGGFALEKVMGSLSTGLKFKIGGFHGRKLRQKDEIPLRSPFLLPHPEKRVAPLPEFPEHLQIRAILGPQDDYFTEEDKQTFFSSPYRVTPASDRMGIRLEGTPLKGIDGMDIVSDGIAPGSVQIPGGGQPIVLMCDRQTTGGYAKIATVYSGDLPKLAQAMPGTAVRFREISLTEAHAALREEHEKFERLTAEINR